MENFLNRDGGVLLFDLIRIIQTSAGKLSEIDGAIGDGDHGVNMNKGFTMCGEQLKGRQFTLSDGLSSLGTLLLTEIGGAMGPLYGTLFREMGKASEDHEYIDAPVFELMLNQAIAGVTVLGNAKIGDKTLIDTLIPAASAFSDAAHAGKTFSQALDEMTVAAERGMDSTRDLIAKIGRSSRLGERSRGVLDAGAVSCFLILQSMARSMTALLS